MSANYRKSKPTATNLKLVKAKLAELRLGGLAPTDDMQPGKYRVACEGAWIERIGSSARAVLQFRIIDGLHTGTELRQWIPAADAGGVVSPLGRYAKQCSIALGRGLDVDDPIADPAKIFAGRIFSVTVGFRKTERPRGGIASEQNAQRRKDEADYLRVHELLEREEL